MNRMVSPHPPLDLRTGRHLEGFKLSGAVLKVASENGSHPIVSKQKPPRPGPISLLPLYSRIPNQWPES